ncbi:unnamed protein product, partial [Hapterophycus canaliculatus]
PPTPSPTVPPRRQGWEEKVDPASGGTYYLNHDTRATTWD